MRTQARLHLLDGLEGAAGVELPPLKVERSFARGGPFTFRLGSIWRFEIINGELQEDVTLEIIKTKKALFLLAKDKAKAAHRKVLDGHKLRNAIPQALKDDYKAWRSERDHLQELEKLNIRKLTAKSILWSPDTFDIFDSARAAAHDLLDCDLRFRQKLHQYRAVSGRTDMEDKTTDRDMEIEEDEDAGDEMFIG
jgi:hypothetical protein